ncbi:unnamed protein product, partial [Prorocentrum cordatum]
AMLSASEGRLQLYVDDPAITLAGSDEGIHCNLDTVLGWWLALGLGLAWRKGVFTLGAHVWIGIQFELRGAVAYVTLPPEFLKATAEIMDTFCGGSGTAPLGLARTATGKVSRIAQ